MFYNYYILFFFDQGLIVMICFFLFLFFAIMSENGQLTLYLQEPQVDARSKLSRHLSIRATLIARAVAYIDGAVARAQKIAVSYGTALLDVAL